MSASQIAIGPPVIHTEVQYRLVDQTQRMVCFENLVRADWYHAFVKTYPQNKAMWAIVWFPKDPMKEPTPMNMMVNHGGGTIEHYSLHASKQEEGSRTFWSSKVRSEPKILVRSLRFDRDARFSLFWDLPNRLHLVGATHGEHSYLTVSSNTAGLCNFGLTRVQLPH